jgi:ferritin-like metal-binding protein YciE
MVLCYIICCTLSRMSNTNTSDILSQKFIVGLNGALAMENAGLERLQSRIQETTLPDIRQQLEHHAQETSQHQKRLQQLITDLGGQPTQEKMELPLPKFPQAMLDKMKNTLTPEELELKITEEDLIIENAELGCYHMLIQKAKLADGQFQTAEDMLSLNMQDEVKMRDWLWTNSSSMLTKMWPKIQSA